MALIEHYTALYLEYQALLSRRQYQVLWLHDIEGLSGKEIAFRLELSQSAVSRHLNRARRKIAAALKNEQEQAHGRKTQEP